METIKIDKILISVKTYKIEYDVDLQGALDMKTVNVGTSTTGHFGVKNTGNFDFDFE